MQAESNNTLITAYVGIGSNLGQPIQQVNNAIEALTAAGFCQVTAISSLYRTKPVAVGEVSSAEAACQPDYINAVVGLQTELSAQQLLDELLSIENHYGRVRSVKGASRVLDLDLLLFGEQQIQTAQLTVPHPGISQRAFVLCPLAELVPHYQLPGKGDIRRLVEQCAADTVQRLPVNQAMTAVCARG